MNTTVIPSLPHTQQNVAQAAGLLRDGKLLVVPTETVYGLALNLLSPEARQRVKALKQLPERPGWVLHVGQPDHIERFIPSLTSIAQRLVQKALPGPVAFQFRLGAQDQAHLRALLGTAADECLVDGLLTFRCPDQLFTQDVITEANVPAAIIAAGLPTGEPPYEAAAVPDPVANAADAIIDGGPTRYRKPSTLVRIEGDRYSVVRAGVIDERIIQRLADFLVLFICSGNTCRSPMAAGIAADLLAKRLGVIPAQLPDKHVVVQSAGLHAMRGSRAAQEAIEALQDQQIDIHTHQSQPATLDLLRRADVIYTMTEAHREEILEMLPGAARKTHRLDPQGDVEDPIGCGPAVYRQVAARLGQLIRQRVDEMVL